MGYLRCKFNNSRINCHGTAQIAITGNEEVWADKQPHICSRDIWLPQVHHLKRALKLVCRSEPGQFETLRSIIDRVKLGYPPEATRRVTIGSVRETMRSERIKRYPPIPQSIQALEATLDTPRGQALLRTRDGRDSLFRGAVGPEGAISLVFFSRRVAQYARKRRIVFSDETFKTRPVLPEFSQVFQINALHRHHVVQLALVLMESRTQVAYASVISFLRDNMPGFQPRKIITDYERAEQAAWEYIFPDAEIQGCYWHFVQAMAMFAKSLNLVLLMNGNRKLKSIVRACSAIPLLPQNLMIRGFRVLIEESLKYNLYDTLEPFFVYFNNIWLTGWRFQTVTVFMAEHRTNNCSESANKMLAAEVGMHRPGIFKFFDALTRHEQGAYFSTPSLNHAIDSERRRNSAVRNDAYVLNNTLDLFEGNISLKKFLHRASTRVMNIFNITLGN